MKLEINLAASTEAEVRAMRVVAVAVLSALPRDEAELAVDLWRAQHRVPDLLAETQDTDQEEGKIFLKNPLPEKNEISRQPEREFEFGGRAFKTTKRGPKAAVDHAVKLMSECETAESLDSRRDGFAGLARTLREIGRDDLADDLNGRVSERRDELAGLYEEASVAEPVQNRSEISLDGQDDIPFGEPEPDPTPAPFADTTAGGAATTHGEHSNGAEEPLRDLMRRARPVLGDGRLNSILEHHGATRLTELDEAGAAGVRSDVLAALDVGK